MLTHKNTFSSWLFLFLACPLGWAQVHFDASELEDIICKEMHAHEAGIHARSVTNAFADQTDIHYQEIHWDINPAERYIKGEITYYFRSKVSDLQSLVLDLSLNLQVNSVTRHGNALDFDHGGDQLLTIGLDKTLNPGELDTVTVQYEGIPPSNGFGSFEQGEHAGAPIVWTLSEPYGVRDWWPAKQDLVDKIDSMDVYITTPVDQLAASNGKLISVMPVGDQWVHHWRHRYPIASYLVAVAVTNYASYSHFLPLDNGDTIEILNYVYPETLTQSMNATVSSLDIMTLYNELFGPYPFAAEKYGHAQFGWGGGMEHQTMSFMGGFSFGLQAHEMAHQWFGDKVTCGSWTEIWLNEGFATYLTGLTYERFSPDNFWPQWKTSTSNSAMSQPGGSVFVDDTTSVNRIFSGRLSYNKGAYLLHMLRWVIGDEAFFAACRAYLDSPGTAYDFGRTEELQGYLEASSGRNLEEFFDDWYYGQGFPSYGLTWTTQADSIIMWLSQTTSDPSVAFFEMPVPVEVQINGERLLFTLSHTAQNQRFSFPITSGTVESITIDPALWLLSKNNTVTEIVTATEDPATDAFILFPNPAKSTVNIISKQDGLQAMFTDMTGRTFSIQVRGQQMDISSLADGFYSIRFFTTEGVFIGSSHLAVHH